MELTFLFAGHSFLAHPKFPQSTSPFIQSMSHVFICLCTPKSHVVKDKNDDTVSHRNVEMTSGRIHSLPHLREPSFLGPINIMQIHLVLYFIAYSLQAGHGFLMPVTYRRQGLDISRSGCPTSDTKTLCIQTALYGNWGAGLNSAVNHADTVWNTFVDQMD